MVFQADYNEIEL